MKFHVLNVAHTNTTRAFEVCAFTSNVRGFCRMMKSLGHEVILYASEDNDAPCNELVTCITKTQQAVVGVNGPETVGNARYEANLPHWQTFNRNAIEALKTRARDGDFLCLISGESRSVAEAYPNLIRVEFSCGYMGVLPFTHRVFPSYAWMHCVYQRQAHPTLWPLGRIDDRVIPHYFDPADFPFREQKQKYLLFVGRLNKDKGYQIAIDTAAALGVRLVVAGKGDKLPSWVDYRGLVGIEERGRLMSEASAVFAPSLYMEPFGKVVVESLLCGTPVITTDWGAFPEIVKSSVGFRCRTSKQFQDAAKACLDGAIDPLICRQYAVDKYSENVISRQYQSYFEELAERRKAR